MTDKACNNSNPQWCLTTCVNV